MTQDYSLILQDSIGRTVTLHISGASIDEAVASGAEDWKAREEAESNAFGNAIAQGLIGDDAWLAV
jgi:hypothetical protein